MAIVFGGKRIPGGIPPRTPLSPLEQALTDRIAAIIRQLALTIDVDAFIEAIRSLNPGLLEDLLAQVSMGRIAPELEAALQEVAEISAKSEGNKAGKASGRRTPERDQTLFNRIDQRTVDYAAIRSSGLIVEIDESNRLAIRQVISQAFTNPYTTEQTAGRLKKIVGLHSRWANAVLKADDANFVRLIGEGYKAEEARSRADVTTKKYRDKLIRSRAMAIARTEIMQAENFGRQAGWESGYEVGYVDDASMKEWRTAPLGSRYGDPCDKCQDVRGPDHRVPWNGAFSNGFVFPPGHPHCFPDGTIVDGPVVQGSTTRWFKGEVIKLSLREGPSLTGTPNHPVLTTEGWIAFGELREGDKVLRSATLQRAAASVNPDDHRHPSRIENVAHTLGGASSVTTGEVPVAGPDFHGDGAKSKVAVVRADGLLWNDACAEFGEPLCEHLLAPTPVPAATLPRLGDALIVPDRVSTSTAGGGGGGAPHRPLLGGATFGHEPVGLGDTPTLHALLKQASENGGAGYAKRLAQTILGLSSEVTTDEVVRVDSVDFVGHVHNLQTEGGYYTANGIIVHNCRCTVVLVPPTRGLEGLPSQDMGSWLDRLDQMYADEGAL